MRTTIRAPFYCIVDGVSIFPINASDEIGAMFKRMGVGSAGILKSKLSGEFTRRCIICWDASQLELKSEIDPKLKVESVFYSFADAINRF